MTKTINIQIQEDVFNETLNDDNLTIIHSDYLLNQNDSQTESNVTQLLKSLPIELQNIATNESGFYMISENKLFNYIKNNVLVESASVEGNYDELQNYFLNELYKSFETHFPNTFNDDFEIINHKNVDKIAEFATNELIKNAKIEINNEKIIIDTEIENEYSSNIHNVNWVEKYVYVNWVQKYVNTIK